MKAATELPACWWPLRWKGSFGEEHSDKISVWGAVITHAMGWSQASGFLELFLICSIITSCLFFQNVTSFPLIWPLLPQERNTALQTQYSGSSKWSQMCLSLFFFLIADWGLVELIFPFISAHPLGLVLNSCHTWAAQESTYETNQPAFLIVLLRLN